MIALCSRHHPKADAGAFSVEQLSSAKAVAAAAPPAAVSERFDWMRRDLLAVIGGSFFLNCPTILAVNGKRKLWFSRDSDGFLLLNFDMPTRSTEPRVRIEENFWTVAPPEDLECPPSGKLIDVRYPNGDRCRIEYREVRSKVELLKRYPPLAMNEGKISCPITTVEITFNVADSELSFGPKKTQIGGIAISDGFYGSIGGACISYSTLLTLYKNQEFGKETLVLDGKEFDGCTFNGTQFIIRGEEQFFFQNTKSSTFDLTLEGGALLGLNQLEWLSRLGFDAWSRIESFFKPQ